MKQEWEDFKASLTDVLSMSRKEFLLTVAVCILGGIVFGMLASPRKSTIIGSHNGNNSSVSRGEKNKKSKKRGGEQIADWDEVEQKELGGLEEA